MADGDLEIGPHLGGGPSALADALPSTLKAVHAHSDRSESILLYPAPRFPPSHRHFAPPLPHPSSSPSLSFSSPRPSRPPDMSSSHPSPTPLGSSHPHPPPLPPKDHHPLSSSPPPLSSSTSSSAPSRRKKLSFTSLGRPPSISMSSSSDTEVTDKEGTGTHKVKDLWSKLSGKERTGSSGSSTPVPLSTSPASQPAPLPTHSPPPPPVKDGTPLKISMIGHAGHGDDVDEFRQSVVAAEQTVDRMTTVNTVLMGLAGALELGAGWLPGVGGGVKVVVEMLAQAQKVALGKVGALRLVERCAVVLTGVQQAVIDNKGMVSVVMQGNIDRLLTNLDSNAYLLTKLASRSFLKLYLHADDNARQLELATSSLDDFVNIFQLQAIISTAAWQEQSMRDRQRDTDMLYRKMDKGFTNDQAMLEMLQTKADEQQETIKTLQRTLDALLAIQAREFAEHHEAGLSSQDITRPGSPYLVESPVHHPLPPVVQTRKRLAIDFEPVDGFQPPPSSIYAAQVVTDVAAKGEAQEEQVRRKRRESLESPQGHREFCERALDVLRRHSATTDLGVPDWTITKLEVTHEERISSGFFSTVWRGRWKEEDVAIKELNPTADRNLFVKEVDVWRKLRSPFILEFLGASSATGPPPWFIVSPLMRNGNVLQYLSTPLGQHTNRLSLLHQISQGMEYLHSRDIYHGDFKAANVLVTDTGEAIICDFGLPHLKMDITTKSRSDPSMQLALAGTMRWQSPERLLGGQMTPGCDVYSFGMTVWEVWTGEVPFGYVDDAQVKRDIIKGGRPPKPDGMSADLWQLVQRCWTQDPRARPSFEEISGLLGKMYPAPQIRRGTTWTSSTDTSTYSSYITASEGGVPSEQRAISPESNAMPLPEPGDETHSSSSGSLPSIPPQLETQPSFESDRAERHYRHYLTHEFDDRLTLPLWYPSQITLGSVGYVRHGQFIKLLDAHRPPLVVSTDGKGGGLPPVPYLDEFSSLQTKEYAVNTRGAADKASEMVAALTSFIRSSGETSQKAISRRISFPLKPGMKQAALIVDDAKFEIYKSFSEARAYLGANVGWILGQYGESHGIVKEDIIIVVGALTAHKYAMIVSNFAPRTTLTFNVHVSPQAGEQWGTWTVNRLQGSTALRGGTGGQGGGEGYGPRTKAETEEMQLKYTCKVSTVSASPMDAVMLAKLRFPPGGSEPTLYP